ENAPELLEAHDRIALVQSRSCAPAKESRRWKLAFASLEEQDRRIVERGAAINAKNDGHLDVAHDSLARHMKMTCEGAGSKPRFMPADDGMQDGDDNDKQSAKRERSLKEQQHPPKEQEMTPEEAAKLLEAAGYKIEKPKTQE